MDIEAINVYSELLYRKCACRECTWRTLLMPLTKYFYGGDLLFSYVALKIDIQTIIKVC